MKWPKWNRRWIPGIVFWVLFLGSLALNEHHPWVDTVWVAAWLLFLIVVAVIALVQAFRHRHDTGDVISYRGTSGWVATLFGDGPEPGDKPFKKSN
jgi:hypothetical protein